MAAWNVAAAGSPRSAGLIVLPGIASLAVNVTGTSAVHLPPGSSLAIVAAQPSASGSAVTWNNSLSTLTGDIAVTGLAAVGPGQAPPPGQLLISGIWLAGQLQVSGEPCSVQVSDSTLVPGMGLLSDGTPVHPGTPSVVVAATGASLTLNRVISGPVAADESGSTMICGSVLDATAPDSPAYAGPDLGTATAGRRPPVPTCTSRAARSSARSAPGPSPWPRIPSSTRAWPATTTGRLPCGPAAGRRGACDSARFRRARSRRGSMSASRPTRLPRRR